MLSLLAKRKYGDNSRPLQNQSAIKLALKKKHCDNFNQGNRTNIRNHMLINRDTYGQAVGCLINRKNRNSISFLSDKQLYGKAGRASLWYDNKCILMVMNNNKQHEPSQTALGSS